MNDSFYYRAGLLFGRYYGRVPEKVKRLYINKFKRFVENRGGFTDPYVAFREFIKSNPKRK